MFIVSVIVYSNSHAAVFTSNVQFVRLAAGRPTQTVDATDQWRDRGSAATVCPLSDDCLLQLVDCRESSTLIDHLLKGTPNSAVDWIQVRAAWVPHMRLDERDILTPQVCRRVPAWLCVTARRPVADIRARC